MSKWWAFIESLTFMFGPNLPSQIEMLRQHHLAECIAIAEGRQFSRWPR